MNTTYGYQGKKPSIICLMPVLGPLSQSSLAKILRLEIISSIELIICFSPEA